MDRYLKACLEENLSTEHILPFFWQHGEPLEVLEEEIDAMYRSNVREFCVESRTHEEFCHDDWWRDFGFMLEEAKKRGMKVWLLDDKRFPTGYANGYVIEHPELKKTVLRLQWADVAGPAEAARIIPMQIAEDESYVAITAFRRDHSGQAFTGEPIDLLGTLEEGLLSFDIPEGNWRVYYVVRTHHINEYDEQWIDMLSPESCQAQIEAVYKPHYEHFGEYFGNVFQGYFSDEPRFGNENGSYLSKLGKPDMVLPWRDDLPALIGSAMDVSADRVRLLLPALFHEYEGREYHTLRCTYMDVITKLYSENFTRLLGEWSRAHGVKYIGHIIEDMNTHQRLGYGPGHFFRALHYQDMSGMDIVLQQIIPGVLDVDHAGPVCGGVLDPSFFNYYLAKLASSQAAIVPHMAGRAMCEIFGAFGWAEGIPFMKQLTDHMISNGINYFVPHAFTPKYPDPDCPPHFYARGKNPQYECFGALMTYMHRCANLISGKHEAPAAVLYTAEAEWADSGKMMFGQFAGKALIRAQIDYDIVWEDVLRDAFVEDSPAGKVLAVGPMRYRVLVIPESEYLPESLLADIAEFMRAGLPVIVAGETAETVAPVSCEEGTPLMNCVCTSVAKLPGLLSEMGVPEIRLTPAAPLVRYRRIVREGKNIYFFFSENVHSETRVTAELVGDGPFRIYDPWTNRLYTPVQEGNQVELLLPASGACFVIEDDAEAPAFDYEACGTAVELKDLRTSINDGAGAFTEIELPVGEDLTRRKGMSRFSGVIRYEGKLELSGTETVLSLGKVGEIAKVTFNGRDLGYGVEDPCTFEIAGLVRAGENEVTIDVVNSPAYRERDHFSTYVILPVSGLIGPMTVK